MRKYFFATFITLALLFYSASYQEPERVFAIVTNTLVVFYFTITIAQNVEDKHEQK